MELRDNIYTIQSKPIADVATEFGLPLYVYDAEIIRERYQRLTSAFSNVPLRLKYAAKALSNISILRYMRSLGLELDAVSIHEVDLALRAGFKPEQILFTPSCVAFEEIEAGVERGVLLNIDSLPMLERFGERYGHDVPCCVRITPNLAGGGNAHIRVGQIDSKFGVSILELDQLVDTVKRYNLHVLGLHVHTGSDILDTDIFVEGARILFKAAERFSELEFINFGGGFKVPYRDGDVVTDIEDLGQKLTKEFRDFCTSYGRQLEMWFEPGKFFVSEAGMLLVEVNTVKQTPATCFVGVNSGQNHFLRPMMYDAHHDIVNVSNPGGKERSYSVVGYICETDTFSWECKLNETRVGDVLAIKNAGAYGFSMSSNYNSRPRPAEVLIHQGEAKLIRRREVFDDLLATQIDVGDGS